jgi:hypothetical protein
MKTGKISWRHFIGYLTACIAESHCSENENAGPSKMTPFLTDFYYYDDEIIIIIITTTIITLYSLYAWCLHFYIWHKPRF